MRLNIPSFLDKEFGYKQICGMSRGMVLTLTSIYQAICPGSKRGFSEWVKTTSLPYHLNLDLAKLSSGEIWYAMDNIEEKKLEKAQRKIVERLLKLHPEMKKFVEEMHLDYTNYCTYISSKNTLCMMCQRGHNKQKRDDLRQYGLALVTAKLMQFPLVWHVYDENVNDKTEFPITIQ